jgi:hypothetical protein
VRKILLILACVLVGLVLLVAVALFALYRAAQQVPEEYQQALQVDPAAQAEASDQMLRQATALRSDVEEEGRWQALFSADEINGWLAVDLAENHPDALPEGVSDPRVVFQPDEATLFCRVRRGNLTSVVSLSIDFYLPEPNQVAVRVRGARAGVVPLPLEKIVERISRSAERLDLRLRWRQTDGDPVAMISVAPTWNGEDKLVYVEELRLGDGEVFVAGTTKKRPESP